MSATQNQEGATVTTIDFRRLITEAQAAEVLGLSIWTLRAGRYNRDGNRARLPEPVRIGRAIRYDVRDLETFIEDLKAGA